MVICLPARTRVINLNQKNIKSLSEYKERKQKERKCGNLRKGRFLTVLTFPLNRYIHLAEIYFHLSLLFFFFFFCWYERAQWFPEWEGGNKERQKKVEARNIGLFLVHPVLYLPFAHIHAEMGEKVGKGATEADGICRLSISKSADPWVVF